MQSMHLSKSYPWCGSFSQKSYNVVKFFWCNAADKECILWQCDLYVSAVHCDLDSYMFDQCSDKEINRIVL